MKTTTHYSYEEVQTISRPDTVLISINGGDTAMPPLQEWAAVYQFRFDDVIPSSSMAAAVNPRYKGKHPKPLRGYDLMTPDHARSLAEVIRKHWDESIHVQCAAGVSRSAAVASVLSALGWEYTIPPARSFGLMHANIHVVCLLREQFPETFGLIGQPIISKTHR